MDKHHLGISSSSSDTRSEFEQIHATCVVLDGVGVLIRGASGAGKSDLALRLMEMQRARLVADDQVLLYRHADGFLMASPVAGFAGFIEVRGIGIVRYPHVERTLISLVVDLTPVAQIERLPQDSPEDNIVHIHEVALPLVRIDPSLPSAVARLLASIRLLCGDGIDGGCGQ